VLLYIFSSIPHIKWQVRKQTEFYIEFPDSWLTDEWRVSAPCACIVTQSRNVITSSWCWNPSTCSISGELAYFLPLNIFSTRYCCVRHWEAILNLRPRHTLPLPFCPDILPARPRKDQGSANANVDVRMLCWPQRKNLLCMASSDN
jgi:hypothetical protein